MNNISLIVTMYNQKELLEICIKWLNEVRGINKVILIDNGSNDGTKEILPKFGYDYILFDEGKQGYGKVWNAAIDNFELDEIVIFMNIRYVVGRNALMSLSEALQEKQNVGIAVPMSNGFMAGQHINIDSIDHMLVMESLKSGQTKKQNNVMLGINDGVWAIRRDFLLKNGRFNENLVEAQSTLIDYEFNMIQKGYYAVVCKEAMVFDIYGGVGNVGIEQMNNKKDREILKENWGMNYFNTLPKYYLTEMVNEDENAEFSVLEVGCDLGSTLLDIQGIYSNCKVCGMEINSAAVNIAKNILDVKEGNIEEQNVSFDEKFDYIIFGDVLEHLHNPNKTIEYCKKKLLKEQGYIIASIPNLMHVSVMQQLLSGRFEYTDLGLLDRTHIHFFTYYEILKMFQEEEFKIESVNTIVTKLSGEQNELINKLMDISINVEKHMYETCQYVVKARC